MKPWATEGPQIKEVSNLKSQLSRWEDSRARYSG